MLPILRGFSRSVKWDSEAREMSGEVRRTAGAAKSMVPILRGFSRSVKWDSAHINDGKL